MKAPAIFETSRLRLTRPEPGDAEEIFTRYAADAEVTRFLSWPRHRSLRDTEEFLRFSAAEWERWPAGPYLIRSRDARQLLGGTGFAFDSLDEAVTGYVLAKDAWGQGYATEALRAIVEMGRRIGVRRLSAFCHPEHEASVRVLRKCGFDQDPGRTRQSAFPNLTGDLPQDVLCYALELRPGTSS